MATNKRTRRAGPTGARLITFLLGVIFLAAGVTKLLGAPFQVEMFGRFQFPAWWFMYVVGGVELVGGAFLLLHRGVGFAAGLLGTVMAGAVLTHFRVSEFVLALLPATLLSLLSLLVLALKTRGDQVRS